MPQPLELPHRDEVALGNGHSVFHSLRISRADRCAGAGLATTYLGSFGDHQRTDQPMARRGSQELAGADVRPLRTDELAPMRRPDQEACGLLETPHGRDRQLWNRDRWHARAGRRDGEPS
jgi:hypothetical protein